MFDGLFFILIQKRPCEIASDMTLWFSAFPNFRKNGRIAASMERSKAKSVSASGGQSPPEPLTRALPLDPAGGSARNPRYRLALCALAMAPLCQILNTPLLTALYLAGFMKNFRPVWFRFKNRASESGAFLVPPWRPFWPDARKQCIRLFPRRTLRHWNATDCVTDSVLYHWPLFSTCCPSSLAFA